MATSHLGRFTAFCPSTFALPTRGTAAYRYGTRNRCGSGNASRKRINCCATGQIRNAAAVPMQRQGEEKKNIRLLACDMDGTILNSKSRITEQNIATVERLLAETDVQFIPATGKSRPGALKGMGRLGDILKDKYPNGVPGVYSQGLVVYSRDGDVIYEEALDGTLSLRVVEIAERFNLSLIAYSGDEIVSAFKDRFTDLLPSYHEPAVLSMEDWSNVIGKQALNKFIFMAKPERIDQVRPLIAQEIGAQANLTQAQANMLEVLPFGCNKGEGLKRFLKAEGIEADNTMCIGDAENDLEMFEFVGLPVAMNNALPSVKKAASVTLEESNDESGVAAAIERFLLQSRAV